MLVNRGKIRQGMTMYQNQSKELKAVMLTYYGTNKCEPTGQLLTTNRTS
jgi:hypothetical protein